MDIQVLLVMARYLSMDSPDAKGEWIDSPEFESGIAQFEKNRGKGRLNIKTTMGFIANLRNIPLEPKILLILVGFLSFYMWPTKR